MQNIVINDKMNKTATLGVTTDRQTDVSDFIICPMLYYGCSVTYL